MTITPTPLKDCFVLQPRVFKDERGLFLETFNKKTFTEATGQVIDFVQDNQSESSLGVLRGLHFQKGAHAQAKLVRTAKGKVLDIVVDLRKESPSFGQHFSIVLDDEKHNQLFIPRGFAHGFITLTERAIFSYKCDNYYHQASESGIIYNDPTLSLDWQLDKDRFIISDKDLLLPTFKEVTA